MEDSIFSSELARRRANTVSQLQSGDGGFRSPKSDRRRSTSDTFLTLPNNNDESQQTIIAKPGRNRAFSYSLPLEVIKRRRKREMQALLARTAGVRRRKSDDSDLAKREKVINTNGRPYRRSISASGGSHQSHREQFVDFPKEERVVTHMSEGDKDDKTVEFDVKFSLLDAIARDDVDEVCEMLRKNPCMDLTVENHLGITPLHRAAIEGSYRCLNLLLSQNVDVNVKDIQGWTPLHDAVYHGHVRCAAALITAGAHVEAETCQYTKPIEMAEEDSMLLLVGRAMAAPGLFFDPDRETLV
ncbi:ankyrin repeat, PH and SEC7 domain containing protein secG isoform X1 [Nematostella vectensis]|uniref:ankyrin repeat, PH and SEC7 domain containing protein secG isoform X1 n=1 Tax=Nematostella vectensis TaxID=45351 RepID=UPI00207705B9|nr:ankyrin repeat, PH and SEC7 domain containing protein secG isoform X1 [Nematostella vectensis]